jgi:competence protein ComGC
MRMLRNKKGFFDIEDLVAVLVYVLVVTLLVAIASIPACDVAQKLEGESSSIDILNAQKELNDMLKTPLPNNLPALIESQKGKQVWGVYDIYDNMGDKEGVAIDVLSENDKIYRGQTYGQFIDNLQFLVSDSDRNFVFDAVTRAMFVREAFPPHVKEVNLEYEEIFIYPEVYVKYGAARIFEKDGESDLINRPPRDRSSKGTVYAFIPLTSDQFGSEPRTATILMTVKGGLNLASTK